MHEISAGDEEVTPGRPRVPSHNGQCIGNLPLELFIKILEEVSLLYRTTRLKWDTNWVAPYQLVCRRWREVICSTPQFWLYISVCSSPRWLELSLMRCADLPATVIVWHPTSPDATFATLRRYASSIGACYVHPDVPEISSPQSGLSSLLATHMPELEILSFDVPYHDQTRIDVDITHSSVPHLMTLYLRRCIAPRDATVYTSLRSLTLSGTLWTFSYGEFLDIIGKCRGLERLSLDQEVLDPFIGDIERLAMNYSTPVLPIPLPRLRYMRLLGQGKIVFHVLGNICAPQATWIDLVLDDDGSGPLITRLLAPNLNLPLHIPFLSSPRAVSLGCWDGGRSELSLQCGSDGHALLSVQHGTTPNQFWPGTANLQPNLVAIMDAFAVASVDTLDIEGCPDQVAVETWQRIFETFSSLRTLHVKGSGTLDSLWAGLRHATRSSLEHGGVVCCPSLSAITTEDHDGVYPRFRFTATATLFKIVRETLRARSKAGANRLQKLQFRLEYSSRLWRQTTRTRGTFVDDVRALVDELDYRDWKT